MPRDSAGTYTLPAGNPVVTATVISSTWANNTMSDLATAMTDSLSRSGQGGMTAPLLHASGTIGAPGISWSLEATSGLYRAGVGDFRYAIGGADIFNITAAGIRGNVAISGSTWPIVVASINPGYLITETDGALDNKNWGMRAVSEQLRFTVISDDFGTALNWMTVDRTATAVDLIDFLGSTRISTTTPTFRWNETDGPANEKVWDMRGDAGQFVFQTRDDTFLNPVTFLTIDRTGTALDTFRLLNITNVLIDSIVKVTSNFEVENSSPRFIIDETDAAANERLWDITATAGLLEFRTRTDADGAGTSFMSVDRTGTAVDNVTWPKFSLFTLNGVPASPAIQITSNRPILEWNESNGTADNRLWGLEAQADQFVGYVSSDAGTAVAWLAVDRTANVVDSVKITPTVFELEAAAPRFLIDETDAAANERLWDSASVAGDLLFRTRTDADAAGVTWLTVTRTGTTVDTISYGAPLKNTLTASGFGSGTVALELIGPLPWFQLNENDAAANNRLWAFMVAGEVLTFSLINDGYSLQKNWLSVNRTAQVVDDVNIDTTQFNVRADGGGTNHFRVDASATAGNTRMMVYDVDNATLERVTVGAADTGGAGFKVLRIPN